jgi:hypothetical protein
MTTSWPPGTRPRPAARAHAIPVHAEACSDYRCPCDAEGKRLFDRQGTDVASMSGTFQPAIVKGAVASSGTGDSQHGRALGEGIVVNDV